MQISQKQLAANHRNALKSTGPGTAAAKAKVAKNAIKHGLLSRHIVIEGESQAEFNDFRAALLDDLDPVGPLEQQLADRIIASLWRLGRVRRIEVELLNNMSASDGELSGNRLPFSVRITKTYDSSPDQYVDEPVCEKEVSKPDTDKSRKHTLGEMVRADLAGSNILGKFHRYEAHIDRILYRALHELQRLQARRQGRQIDAPDVLDIDITTTPTDR